MKLKYFKRLLEEDGKEENNSDTPENLALKIVSIFVFLGMAMAFGLMPYYIKALRQRFALYFWFGLLWVSQGCQHPNYKQRIQVRQIRFG